ncbi:FAD-binding oxidoreductase [Halomonas sp. SL1]|uniref:NAD(P)/FAD-dependent oxidoreductase n=1 Tax=Halomonas sp. SL1 TaxID=2137478 RepID=UPI000D17B47F|nr:FAD-binding oxidoreductase [Halomonas sp. SL1]RAH36553.1 FAD-binding oxidoreductase [Halomonas sp. SL1]
MPLRPDERMSPPWNVLQASRDSVPVDANAGAASTGGCLAGHQPYGRYLEVDVPFQNHDELERFNRVTSGFTGITMKDSGNYYKTTTNYDLDAASLTSDQTADVCVIGGGYTGVNTAIELAERGIDVVLLEANEIGWGGSGRNGGQVICGVGHEPELIKQHLSSDEFSQLFGMGLEAVQTLKGRIDKYDIQCDFNWGYCTVAYDQKRLSALKEMQDFLKQQDYPFETRLLEGDALHQVVRGEPYVGGLLDRGSGYLHPLNLVQGEAMAAQALGVRLYQNTAVERVEKGNKVVVHTSGGKVTANTLVYACNAYLDGLESHLDERFVTTNAFSIATEPLTDDQIRAFMPARAAICDNRPVIDYYRLSADNRLLFGGATHFLEYLPRDLEGHLRKNLRKVFPQLADIGVDHAWSGRMALGANLFPQVGQLPGHPNIFFAQGYAGFGVAPSHLIAKSLAKAISGEAGHFDILSRVKHSRILAARPLNALWVTGGKCWHQIEAKLH